MLLSGMDATYHEASSILVAQGESDIEYAKTITTEVENNLSIISLDGCVQLVKLGEENKTIHSEASSSFLKIAQGVEEKTKSLSYTIKQSAKEYMFKLLF